MWRLGQLQHARSLLSILKRPDLLAQRSLLLAHRALWICLLRRRSQRKHPACSSSARQARDLSTLAASQRPVGVRPSCLPISPRPRLTNSSASELRARAAGSSGPASTSGTPASPEARSCGSSGICASRETG
jgi:hypothetical protein